MGLLDQFQGKQFTPQPKGEGLQTMFQLLKQHGSKIVQNLDKRNKAIAGLLDNPESPEGLAAAMEMVGFAPLGMLKVGAGAMAKGPRAETMRIAQANAAKPVSEGGLGLRPDNTPMERAKAMGFDSPLFHETSGDRMEQIISFDPRKASAAASDNETPYAVFTKQHGNSIGLGGDREVQMPLLARLGNQNAYRDRQELLNHLAYDDASRDAIFAANQYDKKMGKKWDSEIEPLTEKMHSEAVTNGARRSNEATAIEDKFLQEWETGNLEQSALAKSAITDFFKKEGIDSVRLMRDDGSFNRAVDTTMILNPANIRSRFAAFDPARRHEADLLGRVDPAILPYLMGLGAVSGYGLSKSGLLDQ